MNDSKTIKLQPRDALILVDVQNDFLPGGSLAVPNGDQVVPVLNRYARLFESRGLPVFATRDWHPLNHCSFQDNGGIWPVHCVQHSHGAEFADGLELPSDTKVISKGDTPTQDNYSGFSCTCLQEQLHRQGCERLFIGGLATDYCVLNTVLDGLTAGFEVLLLRDGIGAVELKPGDGAQAIAQMQAVGAQPVTLEVICDGSA